MTDTELCSLAAAQREALFGQQPSAGTVAAQLRDAVEGVINK
jgi:hypothetical protein